MSKLILIELTESQRDGLLSIKKKGQNWRERERAETILLLASGCSIKSIADQQVLCTEAVRIRRQKWLKTGFASLLEPTRSGAPSKLTDIHRQKLGLWVGKEAMSSQEILSRLEIDFQVHIGATTLRTELKKLGYVWKGIRYQLKIRPDPFEGIGQVPRY